MTHYRPSELNPKKGGFNDNATNLAQDSSGTRQLIQNRSVLGKELLRVWEINAEIKRSAELTVWHFVLSVPNCKFLGKGKLL